MDAWLLCLTSKGAREVGGKHSLACEQDAAVVTSVDRTFIDKSARGYIKRLKLCTSRMSIGCVP